MEKSLIVSLPNFELSGCAHMDAVKSPELSVRGYIFLLPARSVSGFYSIGLLVKTTARCNAENA